MQDQRQNTPSPNDHANLLALLDAVSRVEYLEVDDDKEQEQSSEIKREEAGRTSTPATETNDAKNAVPAKATTSPRTNTCKRPKKSTSSSPTKNIFAEELMKVVTDPANESIITFLPSGKEFVVLDEKAFLHDVMPRSGLVLGNAGNKEGKSSIEIASFTRRLNRWGFRQIRVKDYEHFMVFTHPQFLRDEPKRCRSITSKVGRSTGAGKRLEEAIVKSKKSKRTSKKKSKTSAQLRREIPLQLRYSCLLRVQANVQRRALMGLDDGTSRPNAFIPHDAVMSATKAVTDAARLALKRDAKIFNNTKQRVASKAFISLDATKTVATSSRATSATASLSSSGSATPIASNIKPKENVAAVAPLAGPATAKIISPSIQLGVLTEFASSRAMFERALSTYAAINGGVQQRQSQNSIAGSAA